MAKSKFFEQIKSAIIEREVEDVYNKGISLYFTDNITHPFACDGLIETKTDNGKILKLIIEYKFDEMLTSKVVRAKIIAQVLFYLKRFENDGMILPNVCLIGDVNECFCFHTNDILSYLDEDVDWSLAPSSAGNCTELVMKIAEDENINPYIFDIDENFSFKEVADKIKSLADNVQRYVRVTEHNISNIFDYFCKKVVKDAKKIQANDLVAIFMGVITDGDNYYQHPTKKNVLVCKDKQINIKGDGFQSFFSYFNRNYTPQEKNKFAEISDRLIEDTNRRNKGEFYTPTLFVDYAHKMISEQFGEDWKEKFVVWDNCSGTKNLTRDYYFKELYCSTLEKAELEISERYNKEAVAFQFDFLNDSLDKLPEGLKEALENNKPIIFFINPPYATAANGKTDGDSKEGCAKTIVNEEMVKCGFGNGSRNLYAQFLYRIMMIKEQYNLTNVHIALFSPTLFLSGTSYKVFREYFCKEFSYNSGVQFKASHFADVADNWGISFSIWNGGETIDKNNFNYKLIDNIDGEIEVVGEKDVYNIDGLTTASDWAKTSSNNEKVEQVYLTSAIKIKESDKFKAYTLNNSIGGFVNSGNNVDKNTQSCYFTCGSISTATGAITHVMKDNFTKCTALFSARKLIEKNWVNSKDEYLAPNEEHPQYQEFVNDSIIFSLFHSASNQSSLRQVEYKGKKWDIKNEFFFMSKNEILDLANEYGFDFTFNDANVSNERYVYTLLQNIELSNEAKVVLDKAIELTKKSFRYRELFNEEHPEYQILNWDASYYQLKAMWKEYMPQEYKEFTELYKKLADKMRPMVYELGFLK